MISRLQFRSLNHVYGRTINPQRSEIISAFEAQRTSPNLLLAQPGRGWPEVDVLSITMPNDSLRDTAISVGFAGFDSRCVDIDSLRVDIASADLPGRGNTRFRAAHILLCHAGHNQEWRDECD